MRGREHRQGELEADAFKLLVELLREQFEQAAHSALARPFSSMKIPPIVSEREAEVEADDLLVDGAEVGTLARPT